MFSDCTSLTILILVLISCRSMSIENKHLFNLYELDPWKIIKENQQSNAK